MFLKYSKNIAIVKSSYENLRYNALGMCGAWCKIGATGGVSDGRAIPNAGVSELDTRCKRDATFRAAPGGTVRSCVLQVNALVAQGLRLSCVIGG